MNILRIIVATLIALAPQFSASQVAEPPDGDNSSIGYPSVKVALQELQSKPGVVVSDRDGWTIIDDSTESDRSLWSFTPMGHPAHPAAVKRTIYDENGSVWIGMRALCEAEKGPCDSLIEEFKALNDKMRESLSVTHPRHDEAVKFASDWLVMLETLDPQKSFGLLTDIFKSNLTKSDWEISLSETKQSLGELQSRSLRRVVWYEDPADAPLPGTYAAVEFDSVYKNESKHFQYIILHSRNGEPFRVMRHESTVFLNEAAEDGEH